VNVFVPADVHKRDLHQYHFSAWKKGLKSLYYCRSLSIQRADTVSEKAVRPAEFTGIPTTSAKPTPNSTTDFEECLACQ
jgi:ribonucleoside-diphosphate reductase alpha chain